MDLSVIIPARGGQRYLAGCLRSVTRCPGDKIGMECIVVCDDGTDETAAITGRYMERDNRIKLVITEERAGAGAYNTGIESAAGNYIMFLETSDRLCEDAWEQIEAAVGEEYADFVAFSQITSRRNGKLKAQMLPLSDVISTDDREARRLLYTDSVLGSCAGKLFKSRIIRDNNLFFQTDHPLYAETVFVTEYFEHSESCLLTKAMILYRPPEDGSAVGAHGVEERLDMLRGLYDLHAGAVGRCNDSALMHGMQVHYLQVLTDLFCGYAAAYGDSKSALETIYAKALEDRFLKSLLGEVDEHWIRSKMTRYEYRLLRKGDAAKMRKHFCIRAKLRLS